ncbi:hypothetical protein, partial [Vibrio anguillarum]|uniref:hypothetical protein n=1 Tax=Vibrio anguillarum TaxID=55601 RepID=UPI001BE4AF45
MTIHLVLFRPKLIAYHKNQANSIRSLQGLIARVACKLAAVEAHLHKYQSLNQDADHQDKK